MDNKIILASASPRRTELLKELISDFEIIPSRCKEYLPPAISPIDAVMLLAYEKAYDVYSQVSYDSSTLVIGADTVVDNGRIIEKPKDKEDALSMLLDLSGKPHWVHTGVSIIGNGIKEVFYDSTKVFFKKYTSDDLKEYLETDEPYDKAGAYAIQGYFGRFIDHIEGDFNNVMGLPTYRLSKYLI